MNTLDRKSERIDRFISISHCILAFTSQHQCRHCRIHYSKHPAPRIPTNPVLTRCNIYCSSQSALHNIYLIASEIDSLVDNDDGRLLWCFECPRVFKWTQANWDVDIALEEHLGNQSKCWIRTERERRNDANHDRDDFYLLNGIAMILKGKSPNERIKYDL